jgi:hypothetical protein
LFEPAQVLTSSVVHAETYKEGIRIPTLFRHFIAVEKTDRTSCGRITGNSEAVSTSCLSTIRPEPEHYGVNDDLFEGSTAGLDDKAADLEDRQVSAPYKEDAISLEISAAPPRAGAYTCGGSM